MNVKVLFIDDISGLAIIRILDGGTYSTLLIKLIKVHMQYSHIRHNEQGKGHHET